MRRQFTLVIAAALLAFIAAAAHAEPILDHLPPDAMGFVVVHNLGGANTKVERLLKIFADVSPQPIPAPLPFLKAATGLGDGLDESGDALIAMLAGAEGPAKPRPLLLVAVSDYSKFATSINGDASGKICRVTLAGEEVLVAQRGGYAMLMNVEHRPTMETLLAAEAKPIDALAPLADWLAATDVAVVLTPSGIDSLSKLGQDALAAQRAALQQQLTDPQFANTLKQLQQSFEMYEAVLGFCGAEVSAAGVGLSIDDATNTKLSKRLVFEKEGQVAKLGDVKPGSQSPIAGFPDETFVFAGGGPVPAGWAEVASGMIRRMTQRYSSESGFEKFDDEKWKKLEDSWKATMSGVQSTASVMLPGDKDEPLISNIFTVVKVDDADAYLKATRDATTMWNDLLDSSTSDLAAKMKYQIEDVEVAGKKGFTMTADVGGAAADPRVPMFGPMLDKLFGADGKFHVHMIPADGKTIASGIGGAEQLAKAVKDAAAGETGLARSAGIQTTTKLLEANAPWQLFVSPKGLVQWIARLVDVVMVQFGGDAPPIPDYPDAPPVGVSFNLAGGQLHAEMVVPVETLQSLAAYIKKCEGKN